MTVANDLKWNTASNIERAQFVCNDCDWTKVTKYIFVNGESRTWTDAEQFCNDNFADVTESR